MALQSTTISSYSNNHMHNSVTCNSNSKGTLTRASLAVICLPFAFAFASLVPSAFISYTSSYSRSGEVYYHCDDEYHNHVGKNYDDVDCASPRIVVEKRVWDCRPQLNTTEVVCAEKYLHCCLCSLELRWSANWIRTRGRPAYSPHARTRPFVAS